jgi:rhamnogalacturonan endolyase
VEFSRRAFTRLAGGGALGTGLIGTAATAPPANAATGKAHQHAHTTVAPPAYTQTSTAITVVNARLSFTLSTVNGRITSLKLDGAELLSGGYGYYDLNTDTAYFVVGYHDPTNTTYAVDQGVDWTRITVTYPGSTTQPYAVRLFYILRTGETGIHIATAFDWDPSRGATHLVQTRHVVRSDPTMFRYHSVEDDPIGVPWRAADSLMPLPSEIATCISKGGAYAPQDTTYWVGALGSSYGKPYYTKYDWSAYKKDHVLHGTMTDVVNSTCRGLWVVAPRHDADNGGPMRQELTIHQTESTPALLNCHVSNHYGAKEPYPSTTWAHLYGPWFLYANSGSTQSGLRADAAGYAKTAYHRAFYDGLGLPYYVPTSGRGGVNGSIATSGTSMAGAVAVLTSPGQDFQRTAEEYQYWTTLTGNGSISISDVRPGTYRLSVYRAGTEDVFVQEPITVNAGAVTQVGSLTWTPPVYGTTAWQIGTFDRTSEEYVNGPEFRNYGLFKLFAGDFPNGVDYVVGKSTDNDWNYAQYQELGGTAQAPWQVTFALDASKFGKAATARLTVALAAWCLDGPVAVPNADGNLTLTVNGTDTSVWTVPHADTGPCTYRSGCSGFWLLNQYEFPASWLDLTGGTNTFQLTINQGSALTNQLAYDALRLDLA